MVHRVRNQGENLAAFGANPKLAIVHLVCVVLYMYILVACAHCVICEFVLLIDVGVQMCSMDTHLSLDNV